MYIYIYIYIYVCECEFFRVLIARYIIITNDLAL